MKIPRQSTPTPQKRRRALRAGGMVSRMRGNDEVYLDVFSYKK